MIAFFSVVQFNVTHGCGSTAIGVLTDVQVIPAGPVVADCHTADASELAVLPVDRFNLVVQIVRGMSARRLESR